MKRTAFKDTYSYFITLPDRLYPFASEIEGRWVRGRRSYEQALALSLESYGLHRLGYKLTLYREAFHFLGSIFFIIAVTFLAKLFLRGEVTIYVVLSAAVAALCFQEFYLHPKLYGQRYAKGIADLFAWVAPIAAYIFLIR